MQCQKCIGSVHFKHSVNTSSVQLLLSVSIDISYYYSCHVLFAISTMSHMSFVNVNCDL